MVSVARQLYTEYGSGLREASVEQIGNVLVNLQKVQPNLANEFAKLLAADGLVQIHPEGKE